MGATTWTCYTPYDPDPNAALERLRRETFAAGNYQKPRADVRKNLDLLLRHTPGARNNPQLLAQIELLKHVFDAVESGSDASLTPGEKRELNRLRALQAAGARLSMLRGIGRAPRSLDELLEEAGEDGTHSVLDIGRITKRRGYASAAPLPPRQLRAAFGSSTPTKAELQAGDWSFTEGIERWQAVFFVVYESGRPAEYCFVGCSGD